MPIRVLIVDDSAFIRDVLAALIARDPELAVVGVAQDPYEARDKIRALDPDVITLDVEMPNMNGIAFLERLMRLRPIPVVMVSTLTQKGADVTVLALELGAVDVVPKPIDGGEQAWEALGADLRAKIHAAATVRPVARPPVPRTAAAAPSMPGTVMHPRAIIAIGASTGGVEALRDILGRMPGDSPPIVLAQHMPAGFTARFAQRLDDTCALTVREAVAGLNLQRGMAVVAPGNRHLTVVHRDGSFQCNIDDSDAVSGHRPSIDVLFRSVAAAAGRHAIGVILTGMGKDGARGLLAMREAGGRTIGQDEATSLVYGMARAAAEIGAVESLLALDAIAARIVAEVTANAAGAV
jgi:two-component system chemotaxis response regulator CheB